MPTFNNVINLSGSAMAISYENKFLGENFANYSRIKKLSLKGHLDFRGSSSNSDNSGVKEALTAYNDILSSAHDHTDSEFRINGRYYGKGRILSVDFSEKNNPVRMGAFNAEIEIYESGNIYDEFQEDPAYPNYYFNIKDALESHEMNFLDSLSESFSFNASEDDSYSYNHSVDFKYISGNSGTDYVSLAKTLATAILNNNTQPDFAFGENAGVYNGAQYKASRHKFNESYDLVDLNFSFSKDLNYLPSESITYTHNNTRSLTRTNEGFIEVTENGQIKSRTDDFTQVELVVPTITGAAYTRCSGMVNDFGVGIAGDTSSSAYQISNQYNSFGKSINRHQNTLDYNISFTNNPRITTSGIHEYTQTISEDFSQGVLSVSENGTFRPYGIKDVNFDATTSIKNIINNSAHLRITNLVSDYLADYSETTSIPSTDYLKRTNFSIDYPKYGQEVSYSCDYSINGKFLSSADSTTYGLHSVEIKSSDTSPKLIRKSYMIPNRGEFLQEGYQTEIGERSINVAAQKIRDTNYISNPPNLQTQLNYLYQLAILEMLKIPSHYPNNIIKEIWISSSKFGFNSENGEISLDLGASFTMVGNDLLGNAGNHVITKRVPGNYNTI